MAGATAVEGSHPTTNIPFQLASETSLAALLADTPQLDWANAVYTKIDQNAGAAGVTDLTTTCGATENVYLMKLVLTTEVAGTVRFEDDDDTDLSGPISLAANGGLVLDDGPYIKTTTGEDLQILTSQKCNGFAVCIVQ